MVYYLLFSRYYENTPLFSLFYQESILRYRFASNMHMSMYVKQEAMKHFTYTATYPAQHLVEVVQARCFAFILESVTHSMQTIIGSLAFTNAEVYNSVSLLEEVLTVYKNRGTHAAPDIPHVQLSKDIMIHKKCCTISP